MKANELMRKKYWIILLIFLFICLVLPFVIELMYTIGESHPIIYTKYSQSDVLGYIASVIGLIISVLAIMLSIQANEIDIKIKHALTMSKKGNEALLIEICNNSGFDCMINSVEVCNKKECIFSHIIKTPPFEVKAKSSTEFIVEAETIKRRLSRIEIQGRKNIKYCINLTGHNRLFLNTKELYKNLDNIEEHYKKLLEGVIESK